LSLALSSTEAAETRHSKFLFERREMDFKKKTKTDCVINLSLTPNVRQISYVLDHVKVAGQKVAPET